MPEINCLTNHIAHLLNLCTIKVPSQNEVRKVLNAIFHFVPIFWERENLNTESIIKGILNKLAEDC